MTTSFLGGMAAVVFDAYGTLFDVDALEGACTHVTDDPGALARLWRAKQLEYAFLRTAIDRYADFGQITSDALDYATAALLVEVDPAERRSLMRAWLALPVFADVPPALERLHGAGLRLGVLSNGTRHMLEPLIANAGLSAVFSTIMTSEEVQTFKPDAHIYALAPERFQARSYEVMFVTANGFDVAGAKAYGLTVCRVNRGGLPLDRLGFTPDLTVSDLGELADRLLARGG